MLTRDTDKQEIVALYNTDPVFKALVGQLVRLQRTNPEKVSALQGVIGSYLEDHRVIKSTVGWVLDSVKSFLVRSFLPESFTVARVQAPLSIMPPPAPPAIALKSPSQRKEERKAGIAKEAETKKRELAKTVLSLVKTREQVEDILANGDKTEIKVADKELDIMLPREQLSQQMILDIMIERFHERLQEQKQKLKEDSILAVIVMLEKNKMIPALSREDKPAELLLQEAANKLKEHSKTLPEIKQEEEREESHEPLYASIKAISAKAKEFKAKHAEKRQDKVVEATVSQPDALGFNVLADVLKEIQSRVEFSRNDPGNFTKANFTQVRGQMASGLQKFGEDGKEIDRKSKITKKETIISLCKKELSKVRDSVAKVGSILIENKPVQVAAIVPEAVVEQPAAPAVAVEEVQPAPAAQVVVPATVQQSLLSRLFGRSSNTAAITK